MSEDIINGSEFKTRLIDLGYKDLSVEDQLFDSETEPKLIED